jgi:hypothetical protein
MVPITSKNWVVTGTDKGFDGFDGLELQDAKIPQLSENEILVLFFSALTGEDSLTSAAGGD